MTMTYTEIKQFKYSRFRGGGFPIIPFVYVHIFISSDGVGTAWRIIPERKWLITMVIFSSPKDRVIFFQVALFWLGNGGDPNHVSKSWDDPPSSVLLFLPGSLWKCSNLTNMFQLAQVRLKWLITMTMTIISKSPNWGYSPS